ncbi:hypothetical protein BZA05DRAFT_165523 [Tricharina praecox]|uniref:uncharacterized protein n=1 Tax=Tricharina praecox TaxID=43433 RepID=UPI002220F427|nr:uncharacterized protein BZA05DRAFT_165523 [Tricharina praecox]KAI5857073.1 hypothetical protein BZA05DRAFT_165523 [Tricharina praecox]
MLMLMLRRLSPPAESLTSGSVTQTTSSVRWPAISEFQRGGAGRGGRALNPRKRSGTDGNALDAGKNNNQRRYRSLAPSFAAFHLLPFVLGTAAACNPHGGGGLCTSDDVQRRLSTLLWRCCWKNTQGGMIGSSLVQCESENEDADVPDLMGECCNDVSLPEGVENEGKKKKKKRRKEEKKKRRKEEEKKKREQP